MIVEECFDAQYIFHIIIPKLNFHIFNFLNLHTHHTCPRFYT
jgi:hypothetical protein